MRAEDSPSLEQYSVFDQKPASDPQVKKGRLRLWIGIFLAFSLLLATLSLLQKSRVSTLFGTGSVYGVVLTSSGSPFRGEIYILGTPLETQTAADGAFLLEGIPSGDQILIVADDQIGRDFPIHVVAGKQVDLGQIRFESTAVPSP